MQPTCPPSSSGLGVLLGCARLVAPICKHNFFTSCSPLCAKLETSARASTQRFASSWKRNLGGSFFLNQKLTLAKVQVAKVHKAKDFFGVAKFSYIIHTISCYIISAYHIPCHSPRTAGGACCTGWPDLMYTVYLFCRHFLVSRCWELINELQITVDTNTTVDSLDFHLSFMFFVS